MSNRLEILPDNSVALVSNITLWEETYSVWLQFQDNWDLLCEQPRLYFSKHLHRHLKRTCFLYFERFYLWRYECHKDQVVCITPIPHVPYRIFVYLFFINDQDRSIAKTSLWFGMCTFELLAVTITFQATLCDPGLESYGNMGAGVENKPPAPPYSLSGPGTYRCPPAPAHASQVPATLRAHGWG